MNNERYTKLDQLNDEVQKLYNQLWKHKPRILKPIYVKRGKNK